MNILYNADRLLRLICNLETLTGIRADILDTHGRNINLNNSRQPFCECINASAEGHARCEACDAEAVAACASLHHVHTYRCHAGICEAVFPVFEGGVPIAYLVFGQLLDDSPIAEQWQQALKGLAWYQGDKDELRQTFFRLRQYSAAEIESYTEILKALASYIQLEGMIRTAERTDAQKLELYLNEHYMEKLSLQSISDALGIGRTKLCSLAKKLSGGKTMTHLLSERRVEAAKAMLLYTNAPVSDVAERTGFSDYNYFTKIFKGLTGKTPSAYRKEFHRDAAPSD